MTVFEEKRNNLVAEAQGILNKAKAENRAVTAEELARAKEIENEIARLDEQIALENKFGDFKPVPTEPKEMTQEEEDIKNFAGFIRNAETKLTKSDNGVVIPASIANKIIDKVHDLCPIYALATRYNVKGTFSIPYVDTTTDDITVAYSDEFTELTSHSNKFASIQLTGYLYGALTLISKSLVNNSDFDLVNFVVARMAEKIAAFLEKELLNGTTAKADGLFKGATQKVTLAAAGAVTADELIDIQESIPDVYQAGAIWIMNKATRTAIRKLKDTEGDYLLNRDISARWGYTLLGKDVYITENVDALGTASKNVIAYGDMSGLAVKEVETASAQVLYEKYATQHAIGVVAWGEFDAKVENAQKIAIGVTPAGK
jgi:HK97 family phage major capsid protein